MTTESTANVGMLKTKYSVPASGKRLLPRHAINQKLQDALNRKLTLITAPAGYGKTSAVLQWLEQGQLSSAWLSIDAGDNDTRVFWRYICAALDGIASGVSRDTEYVFASEELFHANVHISILIDRLSTLPSDFFLVLDDFHMVTNQTVLDSLIYFLTYLPENMHLVLISRSAPGLHIAKLMIKEDMQTIGVRELRFDTQEISRYYRAKGYFLQTEEIQRIESYTEGWAAALVAVALSLKDEAARHTLISGFGKSKMHIESYLSEDVLHMWTSVQQDFMEKTSILERLTGPLSEALTGHDGGRVLRELYEQNSFLVALDSEGRWFRYHHLFSDFLRKRLFEKDPSAVRELHRRAGDWFEKNEYYDEAIDHYLKAGEQDNALCLIEKRAAAVVREGEYPKIINWIGKLPDTMIENAPRIMLVKILHLTSIGDFKKARKCMAHVESVLDRKADCSDFIKTEYLLVKANLHILQGDIDKSIEVISGITAGTDIANKPFADFNLYDISMYRCPYRILTKMLIERPADYESFCKSYRELIVTTPGYFQLWKGETLYERGMLDEAIPELIAAGDEAIHAGCPGALVPAMVTLAKIRRARGDMPGAMGIMEECERRAAELHKPHWEYMLQAFKVRLYIDMDDTDKIAKWMKENRLTIYQDITRMREYELIVFARVLIYQHRYSDAGLLLNRLLLFSEGLERNHSSVEIANLLAITAMRDLDEKNAMKHLDTALSIGSKEGYVSSFVDELAPMIALLETYITKHSGGDRLIAYAADLLDRTKSCSSHLVFPSSANAVDSLLTSMEKKVLRLIMNTYTNKEIAEELGITLRTVKAHVGSIYKKLGVENRVQCIKKMG